MHEERRSVDPKLAFDAVSLEYGSLREEIASRMDRRFRTLAFLGVIAGLVLGFGSDTADHMDFPPPWALWIVSALAAVGLVVWTNAGHGIGKLSERVAVLEQHINTIVGNQVLRWESDHQDRNWYSPSRYAFGRGRRPKYPTAVLQRSPSSRHRGSFLLVLFVAAWVAGRLVRAGAVRPGRR